MHHRRGVFVVLLVLHLALMAAAGQVAVGGRAGKANGNTHSVTMSGWCSREYVHCSLTHTCNNGDEKISDEGSCGMVSRNVRCLQKFCCEGYHRVGAACIDINACATTPCGLDASCRDLPPPYGSDASGRVCTCPNEYTGDPEVLCKRKPLYSGFAASIDFLCVTFPLLLFFVSMYGAELYKSAPGLVRAVYLENLGSVSLPLMSLVSFFVGFAMTGSNISAAAALLTALLFCKNSVLNTSMFGIVANALFGIFSIGLMLIPWVRQMDMEIDKEASKVIGFNFLHFGSTVMMLLESNNDDERKMKNVLRALAIVRLVGECSMSIAKYGSIEPNLVFCIAVLVAVPVCRWIGKQMFAAGPPQIKRVEVKKQKRHGRKRYTERREAPMQPIFSNMFTIKGRRARLSYFLLIVSSSLLYLLLVSIIFAMAQRNVLLLAYIVSIPFYVIRFAARVQRLHDMSVSGWILVPIGIVDTLLTIGAVEVPLGALLPFIFDLILTFVAGTSGENPYGPDPLYIEEEVGSSSSDSSSEDSDREKRKKKDRKSSRQPNIQINIGYDPLKGLQQTIDKAKSKRHQESSSEEEEEEEEERSSQESSIDTSASGSEQEENEEDMTALQQEVDTSNILYSRRERRPVPASSLETTTTIFSESDESDEEWVPTEDESD